MALALGPVCRLRTRAFYSMILSRSNWSGIMPWSEDARADLYFWCEAFEDWHGRPFWFVDPKVRVLTWSDASDTGWGGLSLKAGSKEVARGDWPQGILLEQRSSTWRELRAVFLVLDSLSRELAGCTCVHRSDNQATVHIIQFGSRRQHLQDEAMAIHRLCMKYGVRLFTEWVPRDENALADYYSKVVDSDDWQVNPTVFKQIDEWWGPHTLDCFASSKTAQLGRFCSRWWNPGCLAIDAFTVDWSEEMVWLSPPIYLIARVLDMLCACKSHGTLIVPQWVSAAWWPRLHDGRSWKGFVKGSLILPRNADIFLRGSCPYNLFGNGTFRGEVLALRLCARERCVC